MTTVIGVQDKEMSANGAGLEQPMAMQHWLGPRAYSNRYEAWDPETSQVRVLDTNYQPVHKQDDKFKRVIIS